MYPMPVIIVLYLRLLYCIVVSDYMNTASCYIGLCNNEMGSHYASVPQTSSQSPTQVAKTLESMSIKYRPDTKVSDDI